MRSAQAAQRTGILRTGSTWLANPAGELWKFLTSVRLALILILLITLAVLAGTLIDQAPQAMLGDREAYARWLEQARGRYGSWTGLMDRLQLFRVFSSIWFRFLVAALTVNIIVCTINRWGSIRTAVLRPRIRMHPTYFERARTATAFSVALPLPDASVAVRQGLRRAGYRTLVDDGPTVAFYADRFRFSRFGTFLSHLSIVLLLVGALMGRIWGWKDDSFVVAEGSTRALPLAPEISVKLDQFQDEWYVEGPPKDYRSEIVIYDRGKEVKRATVRVNSPTSYKGIRFHQSFFGQAAVMKVADANGNLLFEDGVPMAWSTRDNPRPVGFFDVPGKSVKAYVVGPEAGTYDAIVPQGTVRLELYDNVTGQLIDIRTLKRNESVTIEGLTFTFLRERPFTGLKVVKDPGVNVVWAASGLMVAGLVMVFWFPHRRFWALCSPREGGGVEVRIAATSQRDLGLERDFERVIASVRRSLAARQRAAQRGDSHV